jgi:hypothetical protein
MKKEKAKKFSCIHELSSYLYFTQKRVEEVGKFYKAEQQSMDIN